MDRSHDALPADLLAIGDRLRDERPALDPIGLDAIAQRAGRRSERRRSRRPTLAVALCLCFGLVFSSAGTGFAISGLASPGTAADAQYPSAVVAQGTTTEPTLGDYDAATPTAKPVAKPTVEAQTTGAAPTQAAQQLGATATNSTLPFTGFAAFPVAGAGLLLLLTGVVLRRRQNERPDPLL